MELYKYQAAGAKTLEYRNKVLLADDMGLGKTAQAIVALDRLWSDGLIKRALIVVPTTLISVWKSEFSKWAPELPSVVYSGADRFGMLKGGMPVLIGSYDTIAKDLQRETSKNTFVDIGIDLLVADEAHFMKNTDSLRWKTISNILASRRWALTGTPLENSIEDLVGVLRFLFQNELGKFDPTSDITKVLKLRDRCMVRRTKDEVGLQLPPKRIINMPVEMNKNQQLEYSAIVEEFEREAEGRESKNNRKNLLVIIQNLRRIATIAQDSTSSKLDLIEQEIETLASRNQKSVVFSSFAGLALEPLYERLKKYGAVLIRGGMTSDEVKDADQRFREDDSVNVMCASLKSAGVGFTWTVANYAFILDLWWNPQAIRQAEDRLYRIGQKSPVLIKRVYSENSIDEAIMELLERKEKLFGAIVEDTPLTTEDDMSFDELIDLIRSKR